MASQTVKDAIERQGQLEEIRRPWEEIWDDVTYHVVPMRAPFRTPVGSEKRRMSKIYDGTAVTALHLFADGMTGYLMSPSLRWFRLRMQIPIRLDRFPPQVRAFMRSLAQYEQLEDVPEIKSWLQECEYILADAMQRSNFYSAMPLCFEDAGSVGTATLYAEEDLAAGRPVYIPVHPREIFIAENYFGDVDTVHRKFKIEARRLVERFGKRAVSAQTARMAERTPYAKVDVLHAVYPRRLRDVNSPLAKNKRYASLWIELGQPHLVHEGGYDLPPYSAWRYKKSSDEVYGWSPAIYSLAETLGINQVSKTLLKAAHLSVDPAYMVPSELEGKVKIYPRGFNYYKDPDRGITPIQTQLSFPVGENREQKMREAIEQHFHVDFFLMLQRAPRQLTATEVIERAGEKAAMLTTTLGRHNYELMDPKMNWLFQTELAAGRLPPPPEILLAAGGGLINVVYMGPLSQAQRRLFQTQGLFLGLEQLQPVAALNQDVLDIVDFDAVTREILDANGFPQKAVRSPEVVMQVRQMREQMRQQIAIREDMAQGVESVKSLAEADQLSGGRIGQAVAGLLQQSGISQEDLVRRAA